MTAYAIPALLGKPYPVAVYEEGPFDPWDYDENHDGEISKAEAIKSVQDYFNDVITKAQAIQVVMLYFG